jgi:glycosyltransferase involved in cell wall biosynthesis
MGYPLVSIIIPVYNAEKYLAETIDSARDQTWPNKEIIIIDDGSTDRSLVIAREYECAGVKVFTQQNKGASTARNKGLQHAKGNYIQYLDADDLISPNKIEDQMLILQNKPGYVCICATVYFFDNEDHHSKNINHEWYSEGSNTPSDFLIKLYSGWDIIPGYGGMITIHSWLCPKNILDAAGPWNEELTVDDDGEYFCRVVLASKGIIYSKTGVNYYRKHQNGESLSAAKSQKDIQSMLLAVDLKYSYLKARTITPILDLIFARHYWEIGVAAYPQYKQLSTKATQKAKLLGYINSKYDGGVLIKLIYKLFGWKTARILSYIKNEF